MLLAPVLDRVYYYLEMPVTGTDDIQQQSELRRAYFTLMLSIASAGMSNVFFSERKRPRSSLQCRRLTLHTIGNAPRLENLLNSIPHYLANGALLPDLKVGFGVVNRLDQEWIKPAQSTETSALPQFKDFIYERVVPLGMELPVRTNFDYSDAQAYQVSRTLSMTLQKLTYSEGYRRDRYSVQDTANPERRGIYLISLDSNFPNLRHARSARSRVPYSPHNSCRWQGLQEMVGAVLPECKEV